MKQFFTQSDGEASAELPACGKRIAPWLPALVWLLCVIQPVLDVFAYCLKGRVDYTIWTSSLRLIVLITGFLAGFLVSRRKAAYLLFILTVALYLCGHILSCLCAPGGYRNWVEDLMDQIRTLVLPITAISFMSFFRAEPKAFSALGAAMCCNLGLIFIVELLSVLTGTDPHTYTTKEIGIRGWFIWSNSQSAILSLLSPLVIVWTLRRFPRRLAPLLFACVLSFGLLYLYGTRLAFFTIAVVGLGLGACVFIYGEKNRRQALTIMLVGLCFVALYPVSPMLQNQKSVWENKRIRQERMNAAAVTAGLPAGETVSKDPAVLRAAYRYNLQGMIDRFGLESVAERYGYCLDAGLICDDRVMKKTFCSLLLDEAEAQWSPITRLFGVELKRLRVENTEIYRFETDEWIRETEIFDPENDFHGIVTLNGIAGLLLLTSFLLWFGLRALLAWWNDRNRFTPIFVAFFAAYGLALLYAYNTLSTLRRNNASVYFAWILAGLWYLSVCPLRKGEEHD